MGSFSVDMRLAGATVVAAILGFLAAAPSARADGWTVGGQNLGNWRDQTNTQINQTNVSGLKWKWTVPTRGDVSATPAVAFGMVYFPDSAGNFYAVNAKTGAVVWSHQISDWTGITGDFARADPLVVGNLVIIGNQAGTHATWSATTGTVGAGASVIAVAAETGAKVWQTQVDSYPAAIVTSSPIADNGVIYVGVASSEEGLAAQQGFPCCVSRGSVVALNAQTGAQIWKTYTLSDDLVAAGYSGGSIWGSTPAIDPKRNSIYVGTGNNFSTPASVANCIAANPTSATCTAAGDNFDSVLSLDLTTGAIKWATRAMTYDTWNVACLYYGAGEFNCPAAPGPDFDFGGSGPQLLHVNNQGATTDIVGIGQKSGIYWALDATTGNVVWTTQVGPGTAIGGIEWGTATDGAKIYVPITDGAINIGLANIPYRLQPSGQWVDAGSWAALNPATGKIIWQTATPGMCSAPDTLAGVTPGCGAFGPPTVANDVVFTSALDPNPTDPTMFALSARTGKILWSYAAGGTVNAGPAVVENSVYWGSGYARLGLGTPHHEFLAFSIGDEP